jgi:hypothetical protein
MHRVPSADQLSGAGGEQTAAGLVLHDLSVDPVESANEDFSLYALTATGYSHGEVVTSSVQKRYRDLHAFYADLAPEIQVETVFPPRSILSLDAEELEERQDQLHTFFCRLARADALSDHGKSALIKFVGLAAQAKTVRSVSADAPPLAPL